MKFKALLIAMVLAFTASQAMAGDSRLAGERTKETGTAWSGSLDLKQGMEDLYDAMMKPFRWMGDQFKKDKPEEM